MKNTEIDIPVEMPGFNAEVNVNYQIDGHVDRVRALEEMRGLARIGGTHVYLEGNFEVADLLVLAYFLDEGV